MKIDKKDQGPEVLSIVKSFVESDQSKIDVTTLKGFIQDLINRMKDIDITGMGAQLAYFFLLSFFPLLIFIVSLLPYLKLNEEHVFDFIQSVVPIEVFLLAQGTITEVLTRQNGGGLISIGVIGTIWSASKGVNALIKTLNGAYETKPKSGIITRAFSLLFTIALVIVILLALIVPIFGQQFIFSLFSSVGAEGSFFEFWKVVRWIIPPLLIFIVLNLMYWVIPNTDPRLHFISVLPGAIFSTISWVILIYGFSYYVNHFGNFTSTYGSIASVIILMLWLYFTGMILIFGGVLNASVANRTLVKKHLKERA